LTEDDFAHRLRIALTEQVRNTADGTLAKLVFVVILRAFQLFQQQLLKIPRTNGAPFRNHSTRHGSSGSLNSGGSVRGATDVVMSWFK
jgi:hypothetical protein